MVIYYTGTGNSRYIAELLAVGLEDKLVCANDFIKAEVRGEFESEKPYILVCPTYAFRIPRVFEDFFTTGAFYGNKRVYWVMTCGDSIGNATYYCEKVTGLQFMKYMGVHAVVMPENYVAKFKVPPAAEQELLIAAAERRIPGLIKEIKGEQSFPMPDGKQATGLMHEISTPMFYQFGVKDKRFRSTDKCTGCGECVGICPLNNIELGDRKLKFLGNCTHCMACISVCPEQALEYGRRTVGKPRYYLRKSAPGLTPDMLVKPIERPKLEEPEDGSGKDE